MDLSRLKWPLIIGIVALSMWLISDGGIAYMYGKLKAYTPYENANEDAMNEAGLSRLAGFLIKTFRYKKGQEILQTCVRRYPDGKNYWHNLYRLAKCAEKLGDYARAVTILEDLMANDAHSKDKRVPDLDVLRVRADRLIGVHELHDFR